VSCKRCPHGYETLVRLPYHGARRDNGPAADAIAEMTGDGAHVHHNMDTDNFDVVRPLSDPGLRLRAHP
jgi:hypothetical protein